MFWKAESQWASRCVWRFTCRSSLGSTPRGFCPAPHQAPTISSVHPPKHELVLLNQTFLLHLRSATMAPSLHRAATIVLVSNCSTILSSPCLHSPCLFYSRQTHVHAVLHDTSLFVPSFHTPLFSSKCNSLPRYLYGLLLHQASVDSWLHWWDLCQCALVSHASPTDFSLQVLVFSFTASVTAWNDSLPFHDISYHETKSETCSHTNVFNEPDPNNYSAYLGLERRLSP